jgi:hypothetical protein
MRLGICHIVQKIFFAILLSLSYKLISFAYFQIIIVKIFRCRAFEVDPSVITFPSNHRNEFTFGNILLNILKLECLYKVGETSTQHHYSLCQYCNQKTKIHLL